MGVVVPPNTTIKIRKNKSYVVGPSVLFVFGIFTPLNNKIQDKIQRKKDFFQYECCF